MEESMTLLLLQLGARHVYKLRDLAAAKSYIYFAQRWTIQQQSVLSRMPKKAWTGAQGSE